MAFTHELDKVRITPYNPHGLLTPRIVNNGINGITDNNHAFPPGFQRINHSGRVPGWLKEIP